MEQVDSQSQRLEELARENASLLDENARLHEALRKQQDSNHRDKTMDKPGLANEPYIVGTVKVFEKNDDMYEFKDCCFVVSERNVLLIYQCENDSLILRAAWNEWCSVTVD